MINNDVLKKATWRPAQEIWCVGGWEGLYRGVTKQEKGRFPKRESKTTSTHNAEEAVIPPLDSAAAEEAVEAPPWPERKSMASRDCRMPTTIVVNSN